MVQRQIIGLSTTESPKTISMRSDIQVVPATKPDTICVATRMISSTRFTGQKKVYSSGIIHSHISDSLPTDYLSYRIHKERKECTILYRIYMVIKPFQASTALRGTDFVLGKFGGS